MSHAALQIDFPQFKALAPAVYAGLAAVSQAVVASGLEKDLIELLKVRASQINGCAFCCQFHLALARAAQVSQAKLDLVAAWRDAELYSPRERAALAWTEALTQISDGLVEDSISVAVQAQFSETEIAHLTAAIGHINAWNRIAVGLHFIPAAPPAPAG